MYNITFVHTRLYIDRRMHMLYICCDILFLIDSFFLHLFVQVFFLALAYLKFAFDFVSCERIGHDREILAERSQCLSIDRRLNRLAHSLDR